MIIPYTCTCIMESSKQDLHCQKEHTKLYKTLLLVLIIKPILSKIDPFNDLKN